MNEWMNEVLLFTFAKKNEVKGKDLKDPKIQSRILKRVSQQKRFQESAWSLSEDLPMRYYLLC